MNDLSSESNRNEVEHSYPNLDRFAQSGTKRNEAERSPETQPAPFPHSGTNRNEVERSSANSPATAPISRSELRTPHSELRIQNTPHSIDLQRITSSFAETLSQRQILAIELILSGERDCAVAERLGIGRTTLWRWQNQNRYFRRALATAREMLFADAIERLRSIVPTAVDRLQQHVEKGDKAAVVTLLRLARVDRYKPPKPSDL